jgi:hypothetical protein
MHLSMQRLGRCLLLKNNNNYTTLISIPYVRRVSRTAKQELNGNATIAINLGNMAGLGLD